MTSFHSALVHCLALAQSSWEKPADAAAEAEKAKSIGKKRGPRDQAAKRFYLPSGALGAWVLCKGFKQGEWSNQCSGNAAFPEAAGLSVCAVSPRRWQDRDAGDAQWPGESDQPQNLGCRIPDCKGQQSRCCPKPLQAPTCEISDVKETIYNVAVLGLWGNSFRFFGDDAT